MTIDNVPGSGSQREGLGRRARPAAHELERYEALFATRTRRMRSSAMRDMFALTERPEVISLAGGLPDTSTFAPELFAKLMSGIAATATARALQYGPTEGMQAAVNCIVEVMAAERTYVDREDVIVATGGQQVIDLVCKTLIDPGDVIVAEAPTYPGAVPTFGAYQADVVQVEMDADGMPIDELESVLDRLAREGRRPKFIYTIPNFQNPGGVTMSLPRRRRLVEIARERELLVLEDNPYGLLRYEGQPLPTLYSLDAHNGNPPLHDDGAGASSDLVIYLGTFSKILAPGLRLGWAVAPRPVLEKLNLGKQGADLCSSPVTQLFVAAYFAERTAAGGPAWLDYVERQKDLYRQRRDVMLQALAEHFGEQARWTEPQGGLFVWATLPDYIDTTDLLALALEREGVAFVPGRSAYVDGGQRWELDAPELRGLARAGDPRGDPADRQGRARAGRPVRIPHGRARTAAAPRRRRGAATGAADAGATGADRHEDMADVFELPRRDGKSQDRRRRGR